MTNDEWIAAMMRPRKAVAPDRLAEHLGLDELSVGARRRGADPARDPRQVLAWWAVTVEPSFGWPLAVGAVHEEEWTAGPHPDRVSARGFVVSLAGAAVTPVDADPIPEALGRLNPFRVVPAHRRPWDAGTTAAEDRWSEVATLDGLGYSVRWETKALCDGGFRFDNPLAGWPLEFERVLYGFARGVVAAAGATELDEALAGWLEHREELAAESEQTGG
jgi:hypothetical protein